MFSRAKCVKFKTFLLMFEGSRFIAVIFKDIKMYILYIHYSETDFATLFTSFTVIDYNLGILFSCFNC